MLLYSYTDYRKSVHWALDRLALRGQRLTYGELAQAMRVQSPYLSKVFSGAAELNEDQIYLLSEKLELSDEEGEYLAILLRYSRASVKARKDKLLRQIQRIQKEKLSPAENRSAAALSSHSTDEAMNRYYLDPWAQIIHMYLSIPIWQKKPMELCEKTGISADHLGSVLKTLEDLGIVQVRDGAYRLLKDQLHLPKTSALCRPQQSLMKTLCLHRSLTPESEAYSFLATFAANEKTRIKIQSEFVEFLKSVERLVADAPSEDVYQIQFDLFGWS